MILALDNSRRSICQKNKETDSEQFVHKLHVSFGHFLSTSNVDYQYFL